MTAPATEAELLATLRGSLTLEELYNLVGACRDLIERDNGLDVVHGRTDTRWRRRLRGALQHARRKGTAHRAGDRVWVLEGTPEQPRTAVLVSLSGERRDVELRLASAVDTLRSFKASVDLVFGDSPYALGVQQGDDVDAGARCYARDSSRVVPGYVDIPKAEFRAFTTEWVTAAAAALRPGGYLVAVTGPEQAAWTQVTAEDAGLTYVNSIKAEVSFPLYTRRRWAHNHWTITVMCSGPLDSARRVFNTPNDRTGRTGKTYGVDTWTAAEVGRADARPGELRYANSLPYRLVDRAVAATTNAGDLMVEAFIGGGTGALVALRRGLRYVGCDLNPGAIAFTARRLARDLGDGLTSTAGPATAQLALL